MSVAKYGISLKIVTISFATPALGTGSLEIKAIWLPKSAYDSMWYEKQGKTTSMETENDVFNDPVAMTKNLCSMVTESGQTPKMATGAHLNRETTAKSATGTAMPLPLKSPYPLGIVILRFEARLRHTLRHIRNNHHKNSTQRSAKINCSFPDSMVECL